ncbi:hypothetical protein ABPG72_022041 [Tetrahymena utriculariae]
MKIVFKFNHFFGGWQKFEAWKRKNRCESENYTLQIAKTSRIFMHSNLSRKFSNKYIYSNTSVCISKISKLIPRWRSSSSYSDSKKPNKNEGKHFKKPNVENILKKSRMFN